MQNLGNRARLKPLVPVYSITYIAIHIYVWYVTDVGSNTLICLYLKVFKYFICNCICIDVLESKVFVFKYFPKIFDVFKYIVCINISVSLSHVILFSN